MKNGIQERTFEFSLKILQLDAQIPTTRAGYVLDKQILRSGTSTGANVEEAESAYTRDVFAYKMNIALVEAREVHYWLRLLRESRMVSPNQVDPVLGEAYAIKKILGAIVSSTRGTSKQ